MTTVFLYVIKTNVGHYKSLYSLLYYILYLIYLELPPTHNIFTNYYTHCFVNILLFFENFVQYIVFTMHRPILTTVPFTNWLCKTLNLILQSFFFPFWLFLGGAATNMLKHVVALWPFLCTTFLLFNSILSIYLLAGLIFIMSCD